MAPARASTVNVATACMSTDASIKKQTFGVEIKKATLSLKEVQDGGSISHDIIIRGRVIAERERGRVRRWGGGFVGMGEVG